MNRTSCLVIYDRHSQFVRYYRFNESDQLPSEVREKLKTLPLIMSKLEAAQMARMQHKGLSAWQDDLTLNRIKYVNTWHSVENQAELN